MKMISGSFWSALASLQVHSFHSRTVTSAQLQDSSTLPHSGLRGLFQLDSTRGCFEPPGLGHHQAARHRRPKPTHSSGHASTYTTYRPEDLCTHDAARTSGGSSRALHARRCVKWSWWVWSLPEKRLQCERCAVFKSRMTITDTDRYCNICFCLTMITTHKEAFSYHLVPALCLPICNSQCHFSTPNSNFVLSKFLAPFRCHA